MSAEAAAARLTVDLANQVCVLSPAIRAELASRFEHWSRPLRGEGGVRGPLDTAKLAETVAAITGAGGHVASKRFRLTAGAGNRRDRLG